MRVLFEISSLVAWVGTSIWVISTPDSLLAFTAFLIAAVYVGYLLVTWEG